MRTLTFLFSLLLISCSSEDKEWEKTNSQEDIQAITLPTIMLNYRDLLSIRSEIQAQSESVKVAYDRLIAEANTILPELAEKVTDGVDYPNGGTGHDFYAIGNYSWYNESTGKWERRDGETNPQAQGPDYDIKRLNTTVSRINILALAWFYSREERYASKATELLRVWFLNEDSKMNPHFEYGCAYGSIRECIGIIYGAQFIRMIDSVQLLTLSSSWTKEDNERLKGWFSEYTEWLLGSELGIEEGNMTNNHGGWYTAQVAASALYNDNMQIVRQMAEKGEKQIVAQVTGPEGIIYNNTSCPQGSLWREMYRTQSFQYSIYGLQALCAIAGCAEIVGVDLWAKEDEEGRGLRSAFEFVTPYLIDPDSWTWKTQTSPATTRYNALTVIRQAAKKYNKSTYRVAANLLSSTATGSSSSRVAWLEGVNP